MILKRNVGLGTIQTLDEAGWGASSGYDKEFCDIQDIYDLIKNEVKNEKGYINSYIIVGDDEIEIDVSRPVVSSIGGNQYKVSYADYIAVTIDCDGMSFIPRAIINDALELIGDTGIDSDDIMEALGDGYYDESILDDATVAESVVYQERLDYSPYTAEEIKELYLER